MTSFQLQDIVFAPVAAPATRLHLGCGPNRLEGWANVDIEARYRPDILHDLSLGLPAAPGTVERIYSEHFWEHLPFDAGQRLFAHCFAALRPGGVLRVAMPDLAYVVERYLGDWRDQAWLRLPEYAFVDSPARMINLCMREWGHQHLYDWPELELRLRQAGFADVRQCAWGESGHADLAGLETRPDSLLVAEATR